MDQTVKISSITVQVGEGESQVLVSADTAPDRSPHSPAQHKMLFALVGGASLDDNDRFEFASNLLGRDVASYKYLTAHEAGRLIDALRGYQLVNVLNMQRHTKLDNGSANYEDERF